MVDEDGRAAVRVDILSARDATPADDDVDMFTQEPPDAVRAIKLRYVHAPAREDAPPVVFVRVYDVEQLATWLERQPAGLPRDPLFASVLFTPQQQREIVRRAAATYCDRLAPEQRKHAALHVALRVYSDDCLVHLLETLPAHYWADQDTLWTLLVEAVQRRRAPAILFLYDEGARQRRYNISTLTTLVLLAFREGWPTRELMRTLLVRLPTTRAHHELDWPWSPALAVVLNTAIAMARYRDVARFNRRLAAYIRPEQLRQLQRTALRSRDPILRALFTK